jgi:hypothetical protein
MLCLTTLTSPSHSMSILGPSLVPFLSKRWIASLKPLAVRYANLAEYKSYGLKYDDILIEESAVAKKVRSQGDSEVLMSRHWDEKGEAARRKRSATTLCAGRRCTLELSKSV